MLNQAHMKGSGRGLEQSNLPFKIPIRLAVTYQESYRKANIKPSQPPTCAAPFREFFRFELVRLGGLYDRHPMKPS